MMGNAFTCFSSPRKASGEFDYLPEQIVTFENDLDEWKRSLVERARLLLVQIGSHFLFKDYNDSFSSDSF